MNPQERLAAILTIASMVLTGCSDNRPGNMIQAAEYPILPNPPLAEPTRIPETLNQHLLTVFYFGPFGEYQENPAQVAVRIFENEDIKADYIQLPVDFDQSSEIMKKALASSPSKFFMVIGVGANQETEIVSAARNSRPEKLKFTFPDDVPPGRIPIDPNRPLEEVVHLPPKSLKRIQETIDSQGLSNIAITDFNTSDSPCYTAAFVLYDFLEKQGGGKNGFLVHLPGINNPNSPTNISAAKDLARLINYLEWH
jgi:pyrrolidone-carboxylate peptidase